MKKRRSLTEEEKKLWDAVKQTAKPLGKKKTGVEESSSPEKKRKPLARVSTPPPPLPKFAAVSARQAGHYAGIDRNTAERFRKGETPIDGTLDLHGMTREKAWQALQRYLRSHYARGSRCLLVITGKGVRQKEGGEGERGILRHALPGWLSEAEFAPMILAFDVAKQKHGGSGAFYILLKRKRS